MITTTGSKFDSKVMTINEILEHDVKFASMMVGYKVYHSSRHNSISETTIYSIYQMLNNDIRYDLRTILLNEVDRRKGEEAVVLYLHNFSKILIELEKSIPKDLYNLIDARRIIASRTNKEMKEIELINVCTCITQDKVKRLIEEANKKEFRSKNMVNKLMIGKVEEVRKETKDIWRKIIVNDPLYKDAFKSS